MSVTAPPPVLPSAQPQCWIITCEFTAATEAEINAHYIDVHRDRLWTCTLCMTKPKFVKHLDFDEHLEKLHPGAQLVCDDCEKKGVSKRCMTVMEFKRHARAEHGKKFPCRGCGQVHDAWAEAQQCLKRVWKSNTKAAKKKWCKGGEQEG